MITGSLVALVTPMQDNGDIDWPALKQLVEWHIAEGTHAIVAVGTTGESATLDVDEHCAVIKAVVDTAAGRIPIIAGTGANSTREAIELTKSAKEAGADACLLVTPYYNKPTQEGLFQHYKAIAEAVDIPQILYNVPGRTGVDMSNATVARLAGVPNIVGIKDATGNLERGQELLTLVGDKMAVYSGDDATAYRLILMGAKGNISVTANVAPKAMSAICEAALAGDAQTANALNQPLEALHRDLFVESNPIPVKWALFSMGRIAQGIRLPLTVLAPQCQDTVRQALTQAGL
ncbi:4-hydroxy-tetrahydrodipicolinate synthase [Agitococcus lubricus]|uniref:4-hydroxy-tetrahydrodipicolinate synthase n=1 Tax=Agitococcus lubricus TaxID=1077255 RepID=A0A2T5IX45_9GAMM|nr:4-hydroxy-tetrahydrodipicolinate synthase [Agitococcus lubricus]PTQ88528.1 dihydrodipicolinate synthase [Agitococcus lubricus]